MSFVFGDRNRYASALAKSAAVFIALAILIGSEVRTIRAALFFSSIS